MTIASATATTLDDLREELRQVRVLLERSLEARRPAQLNHEDRRLPATLLPATAGAFGSEPFASRDLVDAPGVRVVVRDLTVKQIGQLLGRSVGRPVGGLAVERAGSALGVCLWRVGAC